MFKKALLFTAVASTLAACAPAPYVQSDPAIIRMGVSSIEDVKKQTSWGGHREDDQIINGKSVHWLTYIVGKTAFYGLSAKMHYETFYFFNDKLVGEENSDTTDEGATNFDVDKAKTIKNGETRQQVIAELGKPSGEFIYPIAKNPGDTGIAYYNINMRLAPLVGKVETLHEALVSLNKTGVDDVIVTDKTYASLERFRWH